MRLVLWLLKAAIFFTLFAFALNNQHVVTLHWFFGTWSQAPLVLVVLLAFTLGLALGVAVMLPRWWRQRRHSKAMQDSLIPAPAPTSASASAATASVAQPPALHEL